MQIISTRQFRDNLAKYLTLAAEEDVVIQRPDGKYILLEPKTKKEINKINSK